MESQRSEYLVGLITICTGPYNEFLERFVDTFKANFCPGKAKLYVLTDQPKQNEERVEYIPIYHLGWPNCTMKRYGIIKTFKDRYKEPWLFNVDVDVYFKDLVQLFEIKGDRVATLHRNIERKREEFNYETRKESTAYISPEEGRHYFIGGFIGGSREAFLKMAEEVDDKMSQDIEKGIRAVWGDESHINRYMIDNPPDRILSPVYMCPQYLDGRKFNGKIIHCHKDFKKVSLKDAKNTNKVNPEDFKTKVYKPKILVTGHKGFIGEKLCKKIEYEFEGIDLKTGDDLLSGKLPKADVVIHLAAQAGVPTSWENPYWDARNNILATLKILQELPDAKIIYPSSGAALEPESPYGLSKRTAEEYIKMLAKDYVILRLSSVYGNKPKGVVDNFLRNEKCVIFGDGTATRDFVHVDDIVEALITAIETPKGVYECGSGEGTTVKQIAEATGKEIVYTNKRKGEKQEVILQNTLPDWEPKIKAIEWIKSTS